jgi:hypothetical protein
MRVSCGCGEPNERHGDNRHITRQDPQQAAAADRDRDHSLTRAHHLGYSHGGCGPLPRTYSHWGQLTLD